MRDTVKLLEHTFLMPIVVYCEFLLIKPAGKITVTMLVASLDVEDFVVCCGIVEVVVVVLLLVVIVIR